jgi:hypothetical protein
MSVEVRLKPIVFTVKSFPKLMIATDGLIVFFTKFGSGVIIQPEANYEIGEYEEGFAMEHFKDYEGEVTLKNE